MTGVNEPTLTLDYGTRTKHVKILRLVDLRIAVPNPWTSFLPVFLGSKVTSLPDLTRSPESLSRTTTRRNHSSKGLISPRCVRSRSVWTSQRLEWRHFTPPIYTRKDWVEDLSQSLLSGVCQEFTQCNNDSIGCKRSPASPNKSVGRPDRG